MPLPATHWQPVQAIVKTAPVPICHCEEANGRRGALSAQREEVPLGCNLGKAVTFSPGLSCYPTGYCEIATAPLGPRNDTSGGREVHQCPSAVESSPYKALRERRYRLALGSRHLNGSPFEAPVWTC